MLITFNHDGLALDALPLLTCRKKEVFRSLVPVYGHHNLHSLLKRAFQSPSLSKNKNCF